MRASPVAAGVLLAVAAAVAFGSTIPVIHRFGAGVGPFATACLLYSGAALAAAVGRRKPGAEARVGIARHGGRLVAVSFAGAVVAPAALAWGLQRVDATGASLLLNGEAFFTALLARAFYREPIGARVGGALLLMAAGGCLVIAPEARAASGGAAIGYAAVALATFGWAVDNTLTRPLSDLSPPAVVGLKASMGAALTAFLAVAAGERPPSLESGAVLAACGATGYGASLQLYLLAQRRMGAARTASVFALAPFLGASIAWATGQGSFGIGTGLAGALFGAGVLLHLSERHGHEHVHPAIEHDHAHRHDDGHHDHVHDPPVAGSHSHPHTHAPRVHAHEHAPDLHHRHDHGSADGDGRHAHGACCAPAPSAVRPPRSVRE